MTPERIAEIASATRLYSVGPDFPNIDKDMTYDAIERAIRQAVNEAYDRAAIRGRITQIEGGLVDDAIRALKLPEE